MTDNQALSDELEALQFALKTENEGYEYYKEASNRTDHPVTKKFFARLAEDEIEHIRLINEFHDSLSESGGSTEINVPETPEKFKVRLKTIFEDAKKNFKDNVKPDTGILEVYRHSMELETKAAEFYKERREVTKFESVKEFYDWLFHFESDHYAMLSETLSYLENPEQWYQNYENSIFEG